MLEKLFVVTTLHIRLQIAISFLLRLFLNLAFFCVWRWNISWWLACHGDREAALGWATRRTRESIKVASHIRWLPSWSVLILFFASLNHRIGLIEWDSGSSYLFRWALVFENRQILGFLVIVIGIRGVVRVAIIFIAIRCLSSSHTQPVHIVIPNVVVHLFLLCFLSHDSLCDHLIIFFHSYGLSHF